MRNSTVNDSDVKEVAEVLIFTKGTCRSVAKHLGISKSTVHNYIRKRLKDIDSDKYVLCDEILRKNKEEAPYRGGLSVKHKYNKRIGGFLC